MQIINPTGLGIRNDSGGSGSHGSKRGSRIHNGVDFKCVKDQAILMPVDGLISRESLPYKDDLKWRGVYIYNERIEIQMWYFIPFKSVIGKIITVGQVIGYAQDIGEKYEGVTAHIHVRIIKIDPLLLFPETDEEIYKRALKEDY